MTGPTRRLALAGIAALAALPGRAAAAPSARLLGPEWTRFGTAGDPDHGAWAAFLGTYLREGADGINRIDYAAARAAQPQLRGYIGALEAVDPTALSRDAAMAYWINLYNALTVALVLEEYPVGSIKEVRGGLLNSGPWDVAAVTVNGAELTLDDIEHRILRPVWRDPRIHYAVNCAALGCPNLAPRPYRSDRLEAMLEAGARSYVNHPRGATVRGGELVVSSIYDWFEADFGGSEAGVIAHLADYAEPPLAAALAGRSEIDADRYDWSLNAAR